MAMNILVCVKRVPATGGKVSLTPDEQEIDTRFLGFTISPHEECAVEEAVRLVEAGMLRAIKKQDFIGKEAYLKQRSEPPAKVLCTLTVDDHTASNGIARYMQGREPVLSAAGQPLTDSHGHRSYVTSAGSGPSIGKQVLLSYLPPEYAKVGTSLKVEYFADHFPVTVAAVGPVPLFDPENKRLRG